LTSDGLAGPGKGEREGKSPQGGISHEAEGLQRKVTSLVDLAKNQNNLKNVWRTQLREYDLERHLSRLKDQVESLQSNHDNTQATIFAHGMKFGTAVFVVTFFVCFVILLLIALLQTKLSLQSLLSWRLS
jgi:hypothetical protein